MNGCFDGLREDVQSCRDLGPGWMMLGAIEEKEVGQMHDHSIYGALTSEIEDALISERPDQRNDNVSRDTCCGKR